MVVCSVCGTSEVKKAMMTPRVNAAKSRSGALSEPASPAEQAMAELKKKIEANSDYVGNDFAREARAMHEGESPERAIHGEAKKLIEDGGPVMPLPFNPNRKAN